MLGIGFKLTSVMIFVSMATMIKAAENVPTGELVFFRSLFALIPILIFQALRGTLRDGWKTKRLPVHILRGIIGVSAMSSIFFALTQLPLPEVTTLGYATPLILVALSAIFLREQVRVFRWSAVLVGMVGVLIIVWPRLTLFTSGAILASGEALGIVAGLTGAVFAAIAMLTTRALVATETSATIVLYFSVIASAVTLLTLPFGWVTPTPSQWLLLIGAGIAGGTAQILLTECYRHADMSIIAPFEYASLLIAIIVGYMVFGDVPTAHMLGGGVIVIAAGIAIIIREHRLGLERAAARKVSTPQG